MINKDTSDKVHQAVLVHDVPGPENQPELTPMDPAQLSDNSHNQTQHTSAIQTGNNKHDEENHVEAIGIANNQSEAPTSSQSGGNNNNNNQTQSINTNKQARVQSNDIKHNHPVGLTQTPTKSQPPAYTTGSPFQPVATPAAHLGGVDAAGAANETRSDDVRSPVSANVLSPSRTMPPEDDIPYGLLVPFDYELPHNAYEEMPMMDFRRGEACGRGRILGRGHFVEKGRTTDNGGRAASGKTSPAASAGGRCTTSGRGTTHGRGMTYGRGMSHNRGMTHSRGARSRARGRGAPFRGRPSMRGKLTPVAEIPATDATVLCVDTSPTGAAAAPEVATPMVVTTAAPSATDAPVPPADSPTLCSGHDGSLPKQQSHYPHWSSSSDTRSCHPVLGLSHLDSEGREPEPHPESLTRWHRVKDWISRRTSKSKRESTSMTTEKGGLLANGRVENETSTEHETDKELKLETRRTSSSNNLNVGNGPTSGEQDHSVQIQTFDDL